MGQRIFRVLPKEYQSNHISHSNSPQLKLFYMICKRLLLCLLCRHVVAGNSNSLSWREYHTKLWLTTSEVRTLLDVAIWVQQLCLVNYLEQPGLILFYVLSINLLWIFLLVISRQFPYGTLLSSSLEKMKFLDWEKREKPLFQYYYHSVIMKQWHL